MTLAISPPIPACHDQILSTGTTPLGGIAVAVRNGRLAGVCFGHRSERAAKRDLLRRLKTRPVATGPRRRGNVSAEEVLDELQRYAEGEPIALSSWDLLTQGETPFTRAVIDACRAIPRGQTQTYGEVAAAAGHPGAAPAVGRVISSNPTPLVVPCHRVLAAGGKLGGYSARQGLAMKRRLLQMEAASP